MLTPHCCYLYFLQNVKRSWIDEREKLFIESSFRCYRYDRLARSWSAATYDSSEALPDRRNRRVLGAVPPDRPQLHHDGLDNRDATVVRRAQALRRIRFRPAGHNRTDEKTKQIDAGNPWTLRKPGRKDVITTTRQINAPVTIVKQIR